MIRRAVTQLIEKHETNNPYEIASQRNIVVLFEQLGDMLGYYNTYKRVHMIHINNGISETERLFTCSHELGHALLHPKLNTPFLRRNTLLSIDRIEREANEFAVELLIPDKLLMEGATLYEAAAICGVPEEVAHLKKPPSQCFWRDDRSYIKL